MAIEFDGLEKVILSLLAYSSASNYAVIKGMERAITYVHSRIPNYPPKPPTSRYRRTLTLWRSITTMTHPQAWSGVGVEGGQIVGYVGTRVKYAPYVIDRERQAWFHRRNGWWTLQDVVESQQQGILDSFTNGFVQSLNSKLGGLVS